MFSLKIISPKGNIFIGEVNLVNVPTTNGVIGIMSLHESLITSVKLGIIEITSNNKKLNIICNGGVLKTQNNILEIFVAEGVISSELLLEQIKLAEQKATIDIQKSDIPTSTLIRLEKQLKYERFKREYIERSGM